MKSKIERQAARRTLRVCPGHNNEQVFQIFGNKLRKKLREPEALIRLRHGVGNTNVERLAVVVFGALEKGEFAVMLKDPATSEDIIDKMMFPSTFVKMYIVGRMIFRHTIDTASDAERVLDTLGIEFIRETSGELSKSELRDAFRLLNKPGPKLFSLSS